MNDKAIITSCEYLRCPDNQGGWCTSPLDYVNSETGEDMCPIHDKAIPREEWVDGEEKHECPECRGTGVVEDMEE